MTSKSQNILFDLYLDSCIKASLDPVWGGEFFATNAVASKHNFVNLQRQVHLYHLVEPSGWPFVSGLALFNFLFSFFLLLNYKEYFFVSFFGFFYALFTILMLGSCVFFWFSDVVVEGTYLGFHTGVVSFGLKIGMGLFIVSEVLFFLSFFWAFFHSSLVPNVEIGGVWPPFGHAVFNSTTIPLANTLILIYSGCAVTWAHKAILYEVFFETTCALIFTLTAAVLFTYFQFLEYSFAPFNISDSIYSSVFFLTTGFHGFHVIIGSLFLFVCLLRHLSSHFTALQHVGFESAIWYWHFVDVVWIGVFFLFYVYV